MSLFLQTYNPKRIQTPFGPPRPMIFPAPRNYPPVRVSDIQGKFLGGLFDEQLKDVAGMFLRARRNMGYPEIK